MVYLRLTCGIWSLQCWARPKEYQKPIEACTRETGVKTQITPKIKQVLDQNVDLSNIDQVPSNAHLSEKESQLYILEDNEAVIKMVIKRRSSTMRTCVPHPPSCSGRQNQREKSKLSVSNPQKRLADISTEGSFTRDEWHNFLHLFDIMNDTPIFL